MQIYVIRHCEATGQAEDAPLTERGFAQAEALAEFLHTTDVEDVICSPYLRAKMTIEPYCQRYGVPVTFDSRLSERVLSTSNLDNWWECLQMTFDDFDLAFPGGESSRQAMVRAAEVIEAVQSNQAKCIALVTHGNLMTLLLRYFDEQFGFNHWADLTNPDVFSVTVTETDKSLVERIWQE